MRLTGIVARVLTTYFRQTFHIGHLKLITSIWYVSSSCSFIYYSSIVRQTMIVSKGRDIRETIKSITGTAVELGEG